MDTGENQPNPHGLPAMFRTLLWWSPWDKLDVEEDQEDIILAAVNEGRLDHWRWIIQTYGKDSIREVLEQRLETELHPESRHLAHLVFGVDHFRHAPRGSD